MGVVVCVCVCVLFSEPLSLYTRLAGKKPFCFIGSEVTHTQDKED